MADQCRVHQTVRLHVRSTQREELVDITSQVEGIVTAAGVRAGTLHLWSLHTTCALTVNEGADPDVAADIVRFLRGLVPVNAGFRHAEGNSDSHVKVSLFGPGLTLLIEDGEPLLGTWQKVFLAEWDGPRSREVACLIHGA
jgi:secondary thiamine-phosphate synthase enzyme